MNSAVATLSVSLWDRITAEPEWTAWILPGEKRTYADLADAVRLRTDALTAQGLKMDDRLIIASADDWAAFTTWLAALLNGMTPIMVAPDAGTERLGGIAAASGARHVVTDTARRAELAATLLDVIVLSADSLTGDSSSEPSLARPTSGIAYILFTSGTTNASKGVVISHDNLDAQLATIARVFRVEPGSKVYNGLVFYHVDGLVQGPLLAAASGATLVRPHPFQPARIEKDMAWLCETEATHMVGAPVLFQMILQGTQRDDYFNRPDFVALLSSSAKLPPAIWDELEDRFGVPVINEYGMTETVAASHFAGPFSEMGGRHTIGRPVGCEARVVDSEGRDVARGQSGELLLKGRNIFGGYLNDPERTAEVFRDGWFCTGDLVVETQDGDHDIIGRITTAINFAGFIVLPEEIDEAIRRHPGVKDVVTVGIDNDVFGQVPFSAFVADQMIDPAKIVATCRAYLEARKVPRQVVQFDVLPRTASGKVDLAAVRTALLELVPSRSKIPHRLPDQILEIAGRVFGVSPTSLSPESTPENTLEWDSFSQTALALEVEEVFDLTLPISDVLAISSLAELTRVVSRELAAAESGGTCRLQTLREGIDLGTIVVMPDLGGRSEYIRNLVPALDSAVTLRSLSADPSAVIEMDRPLMHDLARNFGAEISASDICRPLVLLGHSFAGYLAYETAAFLARNGDPVDGIVLLDTAVPWRFRPDAPIRRISFALRGAWKKLRHRGESDAEILWEPGFWRLDLSKQPKSLHGILRNRYHAMTRYRPSLSSVSILLFVADRRWDKSYFAGRSLGWGRFTSGEVRFTRAGRDHLSQVRDPQTAATIAEEISSHMRALARP